MPFKKLHPYLKEKLEFLEITTPTPFQSKSIPVIKSGVNIYCTAKKGSGKTTTLILTTLQKLKFEAIGTAPRAIILIENKDSALELYDAFLKFTRFSSMRIYVAEEKVHIDLHKSEIFEGVDILIATPKAMDTLFLHNAVGTSQIKMFSVDDAEFLSQKTAYSNLMSITQSLPKCQFVFYSEKIDPALKRLKSYFMEYSKTVSI